MKTLFISGFCLLSSLLYSQSDWDYVTSSVDGGDWFIKNVTKPQNASSDDYDFWIKIVDSKKFKHKDGSATIKRFTSKMLHYKIDCSKQQYTITSQIKFNYEGIAIESIDKPEIREVVPDTTGESIFQYICEKP